MRSFAVDYEKLSSTIDKRFYKLSEVKNRIEKVAFDVVRFKDGNPDELWQVQNSDDGDYIVARYETTDDKIEAKAANSWDVLVSEASGDINVFYKGIPLVKVASKKLGLSSEDLTFIKHFLPNKLASDKDFVKALLSTLDNNSKEELLKIYPELL